MHLRQLLARVVVGEDINPVRTLFERTILRIAPDAEVCHAADGTQALRAIEAAAAEGLPFTLCISDIHMPNMSGIELVNTTRDHLGQDAPAFLPCPSGALGHRAQVKISQGTLVIARWEPHGRVLAQIPSGAPRGGH